jgi:hypothetical protein
VRLTGRDIAGLVRAASSAAPPATCSRCPPGVREDRLRAIAARWRRAAMAGTGRLGPGPEWCWLTRAGLAAAGLGFAPGIPALAHLRAVLAVRLSLEAGDAWQQAGRTGAPSGASAPPCPAGSPPATSKDGGCTVAARPGVLVGQGAGALCGSSAECQHSARCTERPRSGYAYSACGTVDMPPRGAAAVRAGRPGCPTSRGARAWTLSAVRLGVRAKIWRVWQKLGAVSFPSLPPWVAPSCRRNCALALAVSGLCSVNP